MTDQVQHLIDRIRKDAVQVAEQHKSETVAQARAQAEQIVADARAQAAALTKDAERQAAELVARGTRSLEQAARDLLLQVGERLEKLIHDMLAEGAGQAMRAEVIEQMLLRLADGFARNGIAEGQIELAVAPADRERLMQFALSRLREKLEQGVTVVADQRLGAGFRLSYAGGSVHHDFSGSAVAQALANLLRPQIAEIVMRAAQVQNVAAGKP